MITPFPYPAMFTPEECREIIRMAEAQDFSEAGLVRGHRTESIRIARTTWLDETGEADWVSERILETVISANRLHFRFDLTEFAEQVQVARYDAQDASHFDWHADCGDGPLASRRKLTLVAQLSDGGTYEGGTLELNASGQLENAEREVGTSMLFPSFVLHRVTPVTRGCRYSLTTWIHGPAFH